MNEKNGAAETDIEWVIVNENGSPFRTMTY